MQNGQSRSLKAIYFGVSKKSIRQYILQYNNSGLVCESSEDTAKEKVKIAIFDNPTVI